MMSGVNYAIYGCSSARTTPGVSLYQSLTLTENNVAVITQDRVFFNILAIGQKYFRFYLIANIFMAAKQFSSWLGRFIYKLG